MADETKDVERLRESLREADRKWARVRAALQAIEAATGESRNFWHARRWLDAQDIYHGDLDGEAVVHAVARAALEPKR